MSEDRPKNRLFNTPKAVKPILNFLKATDIGRRPKENEEEEGENNRLDEQGLDRLEREEAEEEGEEEEEEEKEEEKKEEKKEKKKEKEEEKKKKKKKKKT